MIEKNLKSNPNPGFTMRMTYMSGRKPCTEIDVNILNQLILIQNFTDDVLHRAFGVAEAPTWEDFEDFLQYRCFPKTLVDHIKKNDLTHQRHVIIIFM